MAKYQQYAEYKDSGVKWLGEIPRDWMATELKRNCKVTDGSHHSPAIEVEGLPFISVTDVGVNKINFIDSKKISDQSFERLVKEGCKPSVGDVLLTKDGTIGRACIVTEQMPDFVILSSLGLLTPSKKLVNKYLYYYLISGINIDQMNSVIHGSALRRMTISKINDLVIAFPQKEEDQTQIASFLDHETAQIDTLIEKQQTLIQLLKEKRQAVISHAVTKGLNPDAPMKDSGVEWLGEVPEHWEVGRVGYYGQVLNGSTPSKANLSYWHPKEVAWLSSGEVNQYYIESPTDYISYKALKECSVTLLPVGTLVMGMIGQGKTRGTSAVTKIEATINQNLAAVIPNENLYSNYAHLFFQAAYKELREDARGGNQAALNCEIIRDFKITIPPINEQRTIFIEVNNISDKFDNLIARAEQAIQLMQERRTALISAAVTGKIDVRGWQMPE